VGIYWGKMLDELSDDALAAAAGYRFIQLPVDAVMGLSGEQFSRQKDCLAQLNIVPRVCSSPLPPDVQVTEMGFNIYVWTEYLKKACRRLAELGCDRLVWNNGRARVLPWEGDIVGVKEQVLQFLYMLCDVAGEHGITVLVEPLGPLRTNFLNSMAEMRTFLDRVGKDNLASMISMRELSEIDLTLHEFSTFADLIGHVHLENPAEKTGQRVAPRPDDGIDYRPFLIQLSHIGYSGMISLPQDATKQTMEYCRRLWEEVA
jgi:sugar phosphate isomerase/epimerase